jgi:dihydroxy-acid dehydratase
VADDRRAAVSRTLLEGAARAPARSYLRNIGYSSEDLRQPIVGVSHSWTDTSPCNAHYDLLVGSASRGAVLAGLDDGDDHLAGAH